jgi:hypothetical protein
MWDGSAMGMNREPRKELKEARTISGAIEKALEKADHAISQLELALAFARK